MRFVEKVKQLATGKTSLERKQEKVANAIIRQKAIASALKEREVQAVKLARERERLHYNQRIEKLRQPKGVFSVVNSEYKTYGNPFGNPRFVRETVVKTKKGKKKIIRRTPNYNIRQTISPSKYDVIGL